MTTTHNFLFFSSFLLFNAAITTLPIYYLLITTTYASNNCNGPCQSQDDCSAELICINGKCNDLQGATPTCTRSTRASGGPPGCISRGSLSPPIVLSGTRAVLTLNDFGPGGPPPKCDNKYHPLPEKVVALSTGWFGNRSRCGKTIRIEAWNGKSTTAKVVDECDSVNGCDKEHAYQAPCRTNVVEASRTVWDALGINTDKAEVVINWSMS